MQSERYPRPRRLDGRLNRQTGLLEVCRRLCIRFRYILMDFYKLVQHLALGSEAETLEVSSSQRFTALTYGTLSCR